MLFIWSCVSCTFRVQCIVECVMFVRCMVMYFVFFFQAEDGIRYLVRSRGLGDVYKRQVLAGAKEAGVTPVKGTCHEEE